LLDLKNQIKILPDYIANQIAAGEVVQRPDSVVKELVENSIDAGATEIAVFIQSAGKQMVHILDNGAGISGDDLPLMLKRHATSKIISQEDLECISSFGFRGEALASIASVANVEVRTKREDSELGYKLVSKPNNEPIIEQMSLEKGTQIFVRNLFYNVPARRKFLRSNLTEMKHISETMTKFAIAHYDKRFTYYDSDNLIFDVHPEELKKRLYALMGSSISGQLLPVDYSDGIIKITGYIGKPAIAKRNNATHYFFLNNRPITSKSLSYAVFLAFENLIDRSFKPFYVLKIELDPHRIDINVHPQKHEVKFDDESLVHNAIKNATLNALRQENILCNIDIEEQQSNMPIEKIYKQDDSDDFLLVNTGTGEIVEPGRDDAPKRQFKQNYSNDNFWKKSSSSKTNYSAEISAYQDCFGNIEIPEEEDAQTILDLKTSDNINESDIWQFSGKYILLRVQNNLIIINIRRAMQRIIYEQQLERIKSEKPVSQKLLFPVQIQLPVNKRLILDEIIDEIIKFGFGVQQQKDVLELYELPPEIDESSASGVFESIIDSYHEYKLLRTGELHDNLAAAIAMHAYIPKNHNMSSPEMMDLIKKLFKCDMPNNCPRGRKTMEALNPDMMM